MKRLLNTLYVTTQGAYLSRERDTLVVRVEKETRLRIPVHTLGGVVCFGRIACSPALMNLCAENDVTISFLSEWGRFVARVHGPVCGNVLLRREQYRKADDTAVSSRIAAAMVAGKIANSRTVLLRAARENEDEEKVSALRHASNRLASLLKSTQSRCDDEKPIESIRASESEAARMYFAVFDDLILTQKESFIFKGRNRRPPLDEVNALLSFVYTILAHDVTSALESVGLDPAVGFLHSDRPGRSSLALDLMEELRPVVADRLVLSLINRQQVKPSGFHHSESGAVIMDDKTRKKLLVTFQKRKQEEIDHPFLREKCRIGMIPHVQAMLLARHVRGDLDGYPPFLWK